MSAATTSLRQVIGLPRHEQYVCLGWERSGCKGQNHYQSNKLEGAHIYVSLEQMFDVANSLTWLVKKKHKSPLHPIYMWNPFKAP